ncbi:MAG: Rieske 2Fe-2S domain-containing protein [Rhodospirillales bacterium]
MFLRNAWYLAAWDDEVTDAPLARRILGEPVVLYRTADGTAAALEDRCPHRAMPLSQGRVVEGDRLQCGYHGLTFATDGRCVRVPGQIMVPPGADVRAFPAVERWRGVWLWMGEPALADPATVPAITWLDDPAWVAPRGKFDLQANYQRLVDNLLDFSHLQFVHERTIGTDSIADIPSRTDRRPGSLAVTRWIVDRPPPPLFAKAGGFAGNVDRWMNCECLFPSNVVFDIGCARAGTGALQGDRSQGIEIRSIHLITPATETTTHYFWAYARNFALADDGVTQLLAKGARATFNEDVEILEAQQRAIARLGDPPTIDINGDAAPLQARRILAAMIDAETAGEGTGARRHYA